MQSNWQQCSPPVWREEGGRAQNIQIRTSRARCAANSKREREKTFEGSLNWQPSEAWMLWAQTLDRTNDPKPASHLNTHTHRHNTPIGDNTESTLMEEWIVSKCVCLRPWTWKFASVHWARGPRTMILLVAPFWGTEVILDPVTFNYCSSAITATAEASIINLNHWALVFF